MRCASANHSTIVRVVCGRRVDGMIVEAINRGGVVGKGRRVSLLVAVLCFISMAAENANLPQPLKLTAQEDHRKMMEQLGIKELRRGAEGMNRNAPNYQNTDEAKANPWPKLPDPLLMKNGERVTSPQMWWEKRRSEIVGDFDRGGYGRVAKDVPAGEGGGNQKNEGKNWGGAAITKQLLGHVDNSAYPPIKVDIQLTLTTPENAAGPVPVMMEFGFIFGGAGGGGFGRGPATRPGLAATLPATRPAFAGFGGPPRGPTWQQQVIAKGWGYAILSPASVQADNGAGLTSGIIGLCNRGQLRKADDWGALRAWAWGASRALDYFETDKTVDAKQVGIEGLSRYGKAAIVALAYDERFAIGFIGSSGEGGVKLHRRNFGELVENVAGSGEYHWMAGNFLKYAGPLTPNDLPVDSHELVALCAPRPVFISAGSPQVEGGWVDAKGMFLAGVGAEPVYKLLGKKGLGTTEFPPIETPLLDGDVSFRQHTAGHTPAPNWPVFITFAERYFKGSPAQTSRARR